MNAFGSDLGLIAVIGPPAAGKSTVCADAAARMAAEVFRLREFAHHCRVSGQIDERLLTTTDAFGWFSDDAVAALLTLAFLTGHRRYSGLVTLENFPGTATQVRMIHEIAQVRRAPVAMVELVISDRLAHDRARHRRACLTCEPDPRGDPHRPARAAPGRPGRCVACDGPLIRRRSDSPSVFAARLRRYRDSSPAIRREALALQVPVRQVDASASPQTCTTAALAAMSSLAALSQRDAYALASAHLKEF